jgi:hypothetical protein
MSGVDTSYQDHTRISHRHVISIQGDSRSIQASPSITQLCGKYKVAIVKSSIGSTWASESSITCTEENSLLRKARSRRRACGILDIVVGSRKAVGRVKQVICVSGVYHAGPLDKRAILRRVVCNELYSLANLAYAILFNWLDRIRGRDDWFDAVGAIAEAERVGIELVDHISGSIAISEARCVDGTSLVIGAGERFRRWDMKPSILWLTAMPMQWGAPG